METPMTDRTLLCDETTGSARRRYNRRVLWLTALYGVLVIGFALILKATHPVTPIRYAMGLVSAAPAVGTIVALGVYLAEEPDEFRRRLLVEAVVWGMGVVMVLTTVWGFVEIFADAPRLLLALIFPIFSVAMAIAHHLLRRRYR
jgi:hypothetical protein